MIVKICGIKDLATMEAALAARADMTGLVFFPPSPRAVTGDQARILAEAARGRAKVVALSVDADDTLLEEIERAANPDLHQLHGSESPARVRDIRASFGKPVIKAIPVAAAHDLDRLPDYAGAADWILFDAKAPKDATRPGGHGRAFDWHLLEGVSRTMPVLLSGGLDPENVADAIRIVTPDGVDVSSGVERALGQKDAAKIAAFVRAARASVGALERAS
jgi:phosphoribosylanthranilate isomerase